MAKNKKVVFKSRNDKRDTKMGYIFLAPWIIGVVLFAIIPFIITIVLSFANYIPGKTDIFEWVGFSNYTNAFVGNLEFNEALIGFVSMELFYVPIILIASFLIALALNQKIKFRATFRTIFFLPVIILSGSLMSMIFSFDTTTTEEVTKLQTSLIYKIIAQYSEQLATIVDYIYDNFVLILWFTGIPIILFINGLQKINKSLYEAASIDGANSWQILWKIIVPIVRPLAVIIAIFSIVQLSILPTSPMYTLIISKIGTSSQNGLVSAFSMVYIFVILLIIGLFALILVPREKKVKEIITKTQKEQKDLTMKKMAEEV